MVPTVTTGETSSTSGISSSDISFNSSCHSCTSGSATRIPTKEPEPDNIIYEAALTKRSPQRGFQRELPGPENTEI